MERLESDSLSFVKPWFSIAFRLFAVALAIGAVAGSLTDSMLEKANAYYDIETTVLSIFFYNLRINMISIVGGLLFGVIPVIILLVNGFLIGYIVMVSLVHVPSMPPIAVFYAIAPHAIPELFSFLFSCALGLRICVGVYSKTTRLNLRNELVFLVLSVLSITVFTYIAAYIEINISAALFKNALH